MVPIGQPLANLRRKGGLGKDVERAAVRAQQLAAVDEDWNCSWPLGWQRHYCVLAGLVDADGALPYIAPGVVFEGDDLGNWLERQKNPGTWAQLSNEQQERLPKLGVQPDQVPSPAPTATRTTKEARAAFQRGLAALAQWKERRARELRAVPLGNTEQAPRPQLLDAGPPLAGELGSQVSLLRADVGRDGTSAQRATLPHPVIIHPPTAR